jgi:hypothetical protein
MSRQENIEATLDKFARYVVQQARSNLTRQKRNTSKRLYESLGYDLRVSSNSFSLSFKMEEYGDYLDKGVSGTKKKYNTPFKYTNKMPPAKAFANWAVKKGLTGVRDEKTGRFIPRKSLQYALARSVYYNGIKPTKFFSRPFGLAFEKLPPKVVEAFKLTNDDFIAYTRRK